MNPCQAVLYPKRPCLSLYHHAKGHHEFSTHSRVTGVVKNTLTMGHPVLIHKYSFNHLFIVTIIIIKFKSIPNSHDSSKFWPSVAICSASDIGSRTLQPRRPSRTAGCCSKGTLSLGSEKGRPMKKSRDCWPNGDAGTDQVLIQITSSVPSSLHACNLNPSKDTIGMTLPSFLESQAQWGNTTLPYPSICLTEFRYWRVKTEQLTFYEEEELEDHSLPHESWNYSIKYFCFFPTYKGCP